ncbi:MULTISPECIES: type II secretion system F family protein [Rhodomicrobium]|uniref:type II secretion system F family protein n=1 Tax=Rhodomicrobium TaxID=1068 RepID=UPI000B4B0E95|nr:MULTISPECIES: type II secretion system F family protein [Rhodomicrobium]
MLIPILTIVTLLLGGVILLVAVLVMTRNARLAVEDRVKLVAPATVAQAPEASLVSSLQKLAAKVDARLRAFFAYGIKHTWGMKAKALTLILLSATGIAITWLLMHRTFGLPLALTVPACLGAGFMLPHSVLGWQQSRVERKFTDVFPDAVDTVARMLRAGLPATLAIRTVGNEATPPVSTVFGMIADQMRIGIPLGEALDASSQRIGLADFRFFSVAVALQHSTGGNLVNTLDVLSQIMRKRRAVRLKAKAVTSEIRLSAYVLGSLPLVTSAALLFIQPDYLSPLISDPRGRVILVIAAGGLIVSTLTMRVMMKSVSGE